MYNNLLIAISTSLVLYLFFNIYVQYVPPLSIKNPPIRSEISNIQPNRNMSSRKNWIENMEQKFRETNGRIKKMCAHYKSTMPTKFNNDEVILKNKVNQYTVIDEKYRLAYCLTPKVLYLLL